jgi:hypothetical protein
LSKRQLDTAKQDAAIILHLKEMYLAFCVEFGDERALALGPFLMTNKFKASTKFKNKALGSIRCVFLCLFLPHALPHSNTQFSSSAAHRALRTRARLWAPQSSRTCTRARRWRKWLVFKQR